MTTLEQATGGQAKGGQRAGLLLAWSFTLTAILAIGLVALTAPLPQRNAATIGDAVAAPNLSSPAGGAVPVGQQEATTSGLGA